MTTTFWSEQYQCLITNAQYQTLECLSLAVHASHPGASHTRKNDIDYPQSRFFMSTYGPRTKEEIVTGELVVRVGGDDTAARIRVNLDGSTNWFFAMLGCYE